MPGVINSACVNPQTVLSDPNCKNVFTDTYNDYVKKMGNFCSQDDNLITNTTCTNFVAKNAFISNMPVKQSLVTAAQKICSANTGNKYSNNKTCVRTYNTKPPIHHTELYIVLFLVFVFCIILGVMGYKRFKKNINHVNPIYRNIHRNNLMHSNQNIRS
jgi:hypothetical protein